MTVISKDFLAAAPGVDAVSFESGSKILTGRLHRPAGLPRAIAVLNGAVGVPQRFYQAFASWLAAEQGIACLTYDYNDFGASSGDRPMARSRATLTDWGLLDQPAAMAKARATVPDVPVWIIGHSFGGAMLAFNGQAAGAARVITLGAGLVHLSDHPWPYRAVAAAFWYGHAPVLTRAFGYLPGRLTGFGADLPAGVYWQWRRWCTQRAFSMVDVGRHLPMPDAGALRAPMKVIAVADDALVPPQAVWRLMAMAPEAIKTQRVLRPADFGLANIGHLGALARQNSMVWPAIMD